ncbi:hypothetical protein SARC_13221 [Sphaeroforma arctica JP610]|uniref:Kazal-like domain-containing protein n=1 Tax=Sphaeroforma arctica JP610 TaxID=667725 RepID=A0A0L0FBU0_9EUKA|nr:hypothetical protein SARC_13221 [Sphaeroforma arctica JP610]KNC74227.1 hypothetical protein SARC_13221 [Sphaeroforma arctica JP610]|eukprot:XP_014148129.1 hypothetical protein SARC_13221 [Sphaeroforma arctica JP610]
MLRQLLVLIPLLQSMATVSATTCSDCSDEKRVEDAPICSINGKTYENRCLLNLDSCMNYGDLSIAFYHEGPCTGPAPAPVCDGICTRQYVPVCASNARTYSNKCVMELEACQTRWGLYVVSEGVCEHEATAEDVIGDGFDGDTVRTTTTCPDQCDDSEFAVVCGTDGKSYINECDLRLAACAKHFPLLAVWYDGTCTEQHADTPLYTDSDVSEYLEQNGRTFGLSQDIVAASNGDTLKGKKLDDNSGPAVSVGLIIGAFVGIVLLTLVVALCTTAIIWKQRKQTKKEQKCSKQRNEPSMYDKGYKGYCSTGDITDDQAKMPTGDIDVDV